MLEKKVNNIKTLFADQRLRKLITISILILAIFFIYSAIFALGKTKSPSKLRPLPHNINSTQGEEVTPAYSNALKIADKERVEKAKDSGGSAMPTIFKTEKKDQIENILNKNEAPIKLKSFKTKQIKNPDYKKLNAYRKQASQILDSLKPVPAEISFYKNQKNKKIAQKEVIIKREPNNVITPPLPGTVLYAEMVSTANSDAPGPVLARLLEGKHKGAILIGSFSKGRDGLIITFKTLSDHKMGVSSSIKAVAVDTKNIGTSIATDIDHHLIEKLALSFTTGFLSGLSDAIRDSGSITTDRPNGTTTISSSSFNSTEKLLIAAGDASREVSSSLEQQFGNRPTTITVNANTPIGILFL